jgi:hypothetical protein
MPVSPLVGFDILEYTCAYPIRIMTASQFSLCLMGEYVTALVRVSFVTL